MVHPVGPGFTVRLSAFDRPDVMRFAIVVPSVDFDNVELVTRVNKRLPSPGVEVLVAKIYELREYQRGNQDYQREKLTFLLKESGP